jgi:EmrB/QacA subfamily drug resistance transporter
MVEYKWIALSNTTLGTLMASTNLTIIMISLPAIFNGIGINPLNSFEYLLWVLFGYNIVTSVLLVTFGRISDIYGRVRLYNLGFAIFTAGSILLSLTPNQGDLGAMEIIIFRIIQGIGAAFLFSNSIAILTDAFPYNERGKALGINQISFLAGSLIGLIIGGVLASINWRYIFLVSVPFGIAGTIWSYLKLKETGTLNRNQKIDWIGNTVFGVGLTAILIGITYGLMPYGNDVMGWTNPWVIASLVIGIGLLVLFPFIEMHVQDPMFRMELFKIRMFAAGNFANILNSIGRGGVMIMLIILLQGIWLPLHGYSFESTPFWAGVYTIPMMLGFVLFGPISGYLSDKYGARFFATLGMIITAATFFVLSTFSYNFDYAPFAIVIFLMGVGGGMFAAPNTASIMNSVPPEHRGAASGMRATLQNVGQTISNALFFTILILSLSSSLPSAISSALNSTGAPQLIPFVENISPTGALFSVFLGYNPISSILNQISNSPQGSTILASLNSDTIHNLLAPTFFANAVAPAIMSSMDISFYIGGILSLGAAIASMLRGGKYIYEEVKSKKSEKEILKMNFKK